MFSMFVNFLPIISKSTHINWTYAMYHLKKYTNQNNVIRISMATKTLTAAISPIINMWQIAMKFCKEISVLHAYFVWQSIEHRSMSMSNVNVKVIKNITITVWAMTFEPEVVETSGWLQNITDENTY